MKFDRKNIPENNSKKIEYVYDKYKSIMYQEAYSILKDKGLSEDAVQQSFMKLIKNIDKIILDDTNKTKRFLIIICRNTAIDIYKQRLYLNKNSNSLDFEIGEDDSDEPINYVEPAKVVIDKETINKVADAIENLPIIYKDVILLEKLYGNTKEQVAELLGVSYETVKKRGLRARKILAESLEREDLK